MIFKKISAFIIVAAISVSAVSCKKAEEKPSGEHDAKIIEAAAAADKWIKLVDEEKYSESWSAASALFRTALKEKAWKELVKTVREPIGKNINRTLASKDYESELPGVPDGEYVILKYRSVFEKKKNAIEVITVMKDPDGKWKGAGYTIK